MMKFNKFFPFFLNNFILYDYKANLFFSTIIKKILINLNKYNIF
jgi:hypothetical protein